MIKLTSTTHGHSKDRKITKTLASWRNILTRCFNKNRSDFDRYGGRGIKVCKRWHEFENFLADMGERPEGMTIGRINNDGHYCKSNCRWETSIQQAGNKCNSNLLTVNGITKTVSRWASDLGCNYHTIEGRLRRGWTPEQATTIKPGSLWRLDRKC
jgi:hypothetical protein